MRGSPPVRRRLHLRLTCHRCLVAPTLVRRFPSATGRGGGTPRKTVRVLRWRLLPREGQHLDGGTDDLTHRTVGLYVGVGHEASSTNGTHICGYGTIGGQTHGFLLTPATGGRRQPGRQGQYQRPDRRAGTLQPGRHDVDSGRVHRQRHGGHQRPDHRACELQEHSVLGRASLPCQSRRAWSCSASVPSPARLRLATTASRLTGRPIANRKTGGVHRSQPGKGQPQGFLR